MVSTNERILQNRVNQLNDQLFDMKMQIWGSGNILMY